MNGTVSLPLWAVVIMALLAALALLDRLLVPSVRWALRKRVSRVIDDLNTRLPIRIQPFKLTRKQVLIERLLYDPEVSRAAEAFARAQGMPRDMAQQKVRSYAEEIVPAFNAYAYFRLGYRVSRWIARLLYRVRVGFVDQEGLERIPRNSTVVFIMNHRSNMDYILVACLAAERTALSYAVGEWARIWPLQTLIRAMGAYFVRRGSGNDLYRCVLRRYVQMATAEGVTQAVFLEGKLSRDGALQSPRLGLLDYMVRTFDPSGDRDLVFVPVGTNYDRTLEDRSLLLRGEPDLPASYRSGAVLGTVRFLLRNLWLLAARRWHRFGYACVNFGSPVSLRQVLAERDLAPAVMPRTDRFRFVRSLANRLMRDVGEVIPVLPVSLVSTILQRRPGNSWSLLEIKAGVHRLISRLEEAGAHVYIPRTDRDYAIDVGLRMLTLRRLVVEVDGLFRIADGELPVLRYYARSIRHLDPRPVSDP